jgi:hypothetical protein
MNQVSEAPQSLNDVITSEIALDLLSSALDPATPEALACARGATLVLTLRRRGITIEKFTGAAR